MKNETEIDLIALAKNCKTVRQTAQILTCSGRTVQRLLDSGQLAGFKVGSRWRVIAPSIDAYIRGQILEYQLETGNIFLTDATDATEGD